MTRPNGNDRLRNHQKENAGGAAWGAGDLQPRQHIEP
jgi:hypothetical protein